MSGERSAVKALLLDMEAQPPSEVAPVRGMAALFRVAIAEDEARGGSNEPSPANPKNRDRIHDIEADLS